MKLKIISTQTGIYDSFLKTGLIARGLAKGIIDIEIFNLHDFAFNERGTIDDTPFGGGAGMVIRVDVVTQAISKLKDPSSRVLLLTPQGKKFKQEDAKRLSKEKNLVLISGRFEGYDERIRGLADEEISVGDYVLTSGDLPAMVLIDAISRQIPGFIEKPQSIEEESFAENLLEYPQYTKPLDFYGQKVPEILLSGNHQKIALWRKEQAQLRTRKRRPDLI